MAERHTIVSEARGEPLPSGRGRCPTPRSAVGQPQRTLVARPERPIDHGADRAVGGRVSAAQRHRPGRPHRPRGGRGTGGVESRRRPASRGRRDEQRLRRPRRAAQREHATGHGRRDRAADRRRRASGRPTGVVSPPAAAACRRRRLCRARVGPLACGGRSCRRTRPQTPQAPSEGRVPRHPPERRPCPAGLHRLSRDPPASTPSRPRLLRRIGAPVLSAGVSRHCDVPPRWRANAALVVPSGQRGLGVGCSTWLRWPIAVAGSRRAGQPRPLGRSRWARAGRGIARRRGS